MSADPSGSRPSSGENEFSLEDLDKIIEAEDPGFKDQMAGIKEAGADSQANIESLNVEGDEASLEKEEDVKKELTGREKFLAKLKAPFVRVANSLKMRWMAFKNRGRLFLSQTKTFLRHGLPERLKYYRARTWAGLKASGAWLKAEKTRFAKLSRVQKIGLIFMIFASVASLVLLTRTFTGPKLPHFSDPLLRSFSKQAAWVKTYQSKDELQDLFSAFPEVEFHVLLNKVIVNLRPDKESGHRPMGAFEIYLGLDSQDTAIEVKDREREMIDIVQRTFEGFSYGEVISQVGKVRMKSAVRDRVNDVLNQGVVYHVYFNTFITTP